jgi:anionic cell wall polymer biosynthesis LytR-Cps2A-Psr (LCP) family protein
MRNDITWWELLVWTIIAVALMFEIVVLDSTRIIQGETIEKLQVQVNSLEKTNDWIEIIRTQLNQLNPDSKDIGQPSSGVRDNYLLLLQFDPVPLSSRSLFHPRERDR